ncbi:MAG: two-component regulator propeller domain-containing protein, partial [Saprospiraceae bacterium]
MKKLFVLGCLTIFIILCSCSQEGHQNKEKERIKDKFTMPGKTILADLPDSLQPKVTYLDDVPKPTSKKITIPPPSKTFIDPRTGVQFPPYAQGYGSFTNYTTEDGLGNDMVHSAFRDKKDQMWFGTMGGGASRYDGKNFTTFNTENGLPSNTVWCIQDDKYGNLWFATNNGLSRYDGKTFVNFSTGQGLPGNDFGRIIEDDSGDLWITVLGHGLVRYDGKTFTNYTTEHGLTSNDIWSMSKDQEGKIWCGTRGGGIFYFDPLIGAKPTFIPLSGQGNWASNSVLSIFEDSDCKMWFGTEESGALCYDGISYINYTPNDGLGCNTILSIKQDKNGTLWFGTCQGLSRLNDQKFFTYSTQQGLSNKMVNCIVDDKAGNLWFGTYGGGVFQYGGDSFVNFKSAPINNNVSSILEDKSGHLWFGTRYSGLSFYDGRIVTTLMPTDGLARNWVNFLMEDTKGDIWFSTYYGGGVGRLRLNLPNEFLNSPTELSTHPAKKKLTEEGPINLTTFTASQGLAFDAVYGITEDKKGNIWFATDGGGISKFDGKSFTAFTKSQGLLNNEVYYIFEDSRGNFWLQYVGADGVTFFNEAYFLNLTTSQGLVDNSINSIAEDTEGNLWFATPKGISIMRKEKIVEMIDKHRDPEFFQSSLFETFTTNQGLPSNVINDIVPDEVDNLLVSSNIGMFFLKGGIHAFSNPGDIQVYNTDEGYPLRSAGGIFKDTKGIIWITTESDKTGLVRFDPKALNRNWDPPQIILQRIRIDDEVINWYNLMSSSPIKETPDTNYIPSYVTEEVNIYGRQLSEEVRDSLKNKFAGVRFDSISSWYPVPLKLELPHAHNNISIDFHANVITRNRLVRYQYMLDGYNKVWNPVTDKSFASFGNLFEGNYTFKVKARSPEGVWSEPIEYSFRVLPPLYRTLWAYGLYGFGFLFIMYLVQLQQKKRTKNIERKNAVQKQAILNERLRISRDLHDEVGATLSG